MTQQPEPPHKNRKIFRPPPPKAAEGDVPVPKQDAIPVEVKAPYMHVRWNKVLPHRPRNSTSIPADLEKAAAPRPRRASGAPVPPPPTAGCWATCSGCNLCGACRKRLCNGGCVRCARCPTCRRWGEQLKEKNPDAVASQSEAVKQPPVIKRQAADPGNAAKAAVTAARPKEAAAGSSPCPYCKEWLPFYHQEGCVKMPYEVWVTAKRAANIVRYGQAVVNTWSVQCQHCASPFASAASKRVHLSGCERRRNEASLPLNTYPAIRDT